MRDSLFNEVASCNSIKKDTPEHVFSFEFYGIFQNNFLTEHLRTTTSEVINLLHMITGQHSTIKTRSQNHNKNNGLKGKNDIFLDIIHHLYDEYTPLLEENIIYLLFHTE